jgi:hypothetical protein
VVLGRLSSSIRTQNWAAIFAEVFLVAIGIFLAFQVDRWYAEQKSQADARERISALAEDVQQNKDELAFQIQQRTAARNAAANLLEMDERDPTNADYDRFYKWLAESSRVQNGRFHRGSYDVLISTGEIDLIPDTLLQKDIAQFFALLNELGAVKQRAVDRQLNVFEPFVNENLDHVQMLEHLHPANEPNGIRQNRPTQDRNQFLQVLGTGPFEGVMASMWHSARDEVRQLEELEEALLSIERRLRRFEELPQD